MFCVRATWTCSLFMFMRGGKVVLMTHGCWRKRLVTRSMDSHGHLRGHTTWWTQACLLAQVSFHLTSQLGTMPRNSILVTGIQQPRKSCTTIDTLPCGWLLNNRLGC